MAGLEGSGTGGRWTSTLAIGQDPGRIDDTVQILAKEG
jgi:hypothetical protein